MILDKLALKLNLKELPRSNQSYFEEKYRKGLAIPNINLVKSYRNKSSMV